MPTKLFDTVVFVDGDTSITPPPAQMVLIDLATINDNVTVNFEAGGAVAGQCIGLQLTSTNTDFQVTPAGDVQGGLDLAALQYAGQCQLYTWDPDHPGGAAWVLVATNYATTLQQLYRIGSTVLLSNPPGSIQLGLNDVGAGLSKVLDIFAGLGTQAAGIDVLQQGGLGAPAYLARMDSDPGEGLRVESQGINQLIVRLRDTLQDVETYLSGTALRFASTVTSARAIVETAQAESAGQQAAALVLKGGAPFAGDDPEFAGPVSVGFDDGTGGGAENGGFVLEPATGRMQMRTRPTLDGDQASIALPVMDAASADAYVPVDGDLYVRQGDEGDPNNRLRGVHLYNNGQGLVGRGYQLFFTDADLSGGVLTVTHGLETSGPLVQVYNDSGSLIDQGSGGLTSISYSDDNTVSLSFGGAISGTWSVIVVGF